MTTPKEYLNMTPEEQERFKQEIKKRHDEEVKKKLDYINMLLRQNKIRDSPKEHDKFCLCATCQKKLKSHNEWAEYYYQQVKKGFQDAF